MKVLVATDSFKGSLSSIDAGYAIKNGILSAMPDADVAVAPLADGGEGTTQTLTQSLNGELVSVEVCGPLQEKVVAVYGYLEKSRTAIIEVSASSGLPLVPVELRNPLNTTTYGMGEMILDALERGAKKFIIGIGGSSTNDGGCGMLQALGFEFYDSNDTIVELGAKGLSDLTSISIDNANPALANCEFLVACDVNIPLYGPNGTCAIYSPQKGATPKMVTDMDKWLKHYAKLTAEVIPNSNPNMPGSGAAGGLGFALAYYLEAKLEPGIDLVIELTNLERQISDADIVITGEGKLDDQTAMGKAPMGIANIAKKYGKKVIAFGGTVAEGAESLLDKGFSELHAIKKDGQTLEQAMNPETAKQNLSDKAEEIFNKL